MKILEYCEKHKNDNPPEIEKPLTTSNLSELVDPYDAKFIDIENLERLFEIILAANYLDIKSLLDLACAKVATLIKSKHLQIFGKTMRGGGGGINNKYERTLRLENEKDGRLTQY